MLSRHSHRKVFQRGKKFHSLCEADFHVDLRDAKRRRESGKSGKISLRGEE